MAGPERYPLFLDRLVRAARIEDTPNRTSHRNENAELSLSAK